MTLQLTRPLMSETGSTWVDILFPPLARPLDLRPPVSPYRSEKMSEIVSGRKEYRKVEHRYPDREVESLEKVSSGRSYILSLCIEETPTTLTFRTLG